MRRDAPQLGACGGQVFKEENTTSRELATVVIAWTPLSRGNAQFYILFHEDRCVTHSYYSFTNRLRGNTAQFSTAVRLPLLPSSLPPFPSPLRRGRSIMRDLPRIP